MRTTDNLFRPRTRYLSDSLARKIHESSMEILERVGAYLFDEESVALYKKAGAKVEDNARVYIPHKLVEQAWAAAPKKIVLHDRRGDPSLTLEKGNVYFGTGSDCIFVLDHRTGERREGKLKDIEEITKVCDALPHIDFLMSVTVPSDVPSGEANRLQMRAMIENSTKPVMFVTNDFKSSIDVVKSAEIVAGGEKAHSKKPYACCYINVTDPLRHNEESLQKLLHFAEKGLPTTYTPMVLRGVNGPVTRAGAVALANAGELVGLVLAQLKNEGAPLIYSGGYGDNFDMGSSINLYAGPESFGVRSAMASFYGLPSFGLGGASDSKAVDGQAAAESALSMMAEAMAGVNLIHDVGYIESGMCYSIEHLLNCSEIIGFIRRYSDSIEVSEETLALDLIAEQGPYGEYLSTDHTVEHFREDWFPALFDRNNFDSWAAAGSTTLHDRAVKGVEDILNTHKPEPLESDIKSKIREVLG